MSATAALLAGVLAGAPQIAIIIDDVGDRAADGARVLALPGPVAVAFLPHAPYAAELAMQAHAAGKEVILHLPLEAVGGAALGPGALRLDTSEDEFRRVFDSDLASLPHVAGVNNHMGSLLTRHPGHMTWLMEAIRARGGLYFVDSFTSVESVALAFAREAGIPATRRDVFLDSESADDRIAFQFERLIELAREHGTALGIGHPYPATLALLERELPRLARRGVVLVSVREVISAQQGVQDRSEAESADRDR